MLRGLGALVLMFLVLVCQHSGCNVNRCEALMCMYGSV